jgi:hypothetical protein
MNIYIYIYTIGPPSIGIPVAPINTSGSGLSGSGLSGSGLSSSFIATTLAPSASHITNTIPYSKRPVHINITNQPVIQLTNINAFENSHMENVFDNTESDFDEVEVLDSSSSSVL